MNAIGPKDGWPTLACCIPAARRLNRADTSNLRRLQHHPRILLRTCEPGYCATRESVACKRCPANVQPFSRSPPHVLDDMISRQQCAAADNGHLIDGGLPVASDSPTGMAGCQGHPTLVLSRGGPSGSHLGHMPSSAVQCSALAYLSGPNVAAT